MRQRTTRLAAGIVTLLALLAAGLVLFLLRTLPLTQGRVELRGTALSAPVSIVRDEMGVPHIYGKTDYDVLFGLGYVHAQDRLFQMDVQRRLAEGRLSELMGEATLPLDRFFRTLGFRRSLDMTLRLTGDHPVLRDIDAYTDGINAWLDEGHFLPPEYALLRRWSVDRWHRNDTFLFLKAFSFSLSVNWVPEMIRLRLLNTIGPRAADLFGKFDWDAEVWRMFARMEPTAETPGETALDKSVDDLLQVTDALPSADASNNWVVGGQFTESGYPIMASDPHLRTQIPSVWYLVELQGETLRTAGGSLPGAPFVFIGHNERVSWSATVMMTDQQDLYLLKTSPNKDNHYEMDGRDEPMQLFNERIAVRGRSEPDYWTARWSRFGPIISDTPHAVAVLTRLAPQYASPLPAMSLHWVGLTVPDRSHLALYAMNRARSAEDIRAALLRDWQQPPINWLFADVDGHFGRVSASLVPVRAEGCTGAVPVPGWRSDTAWRGFHPTSVMPVETDPRRGYIVTANNREVTEAGGPVHFATDFAPSYRMYRARNELQRLLHRHSHSGQPITLDDMVALQSDTFSLRAELVVPWLLRALRCAEASATARHIWAAALNETGVSASLVADAVRVLGEWNYYLDTLSSGASIYEMLVRELLLTLVSDDLGHDTELVARTLSLDPLSGTLDELLVGVALRAADDSLQCTQPGDAPAEMQASHGAGPLLFPQRDLLAARVGGPGAHLAALEGPALDRWCDRSDTPAVQETCADAVRVAMVRAVAQLRRRFGHAEVARWPWGALHQSLLSHALSAVPVLGRLLDRRAMGAGDAHTLNAQSVEVFASDLRRLRSHHGPGFRMALDLVKLRDVQRTGGGHAVALFSIDTGASGNPLSAHYTSMVRMFRPERGGVAGTWPLVFGGGPAAVPNGLRLELVPVRAAAGEPQRPAVAEPPISAAATDEHEL